MRRMVSAPRSRPAAARRFMKIMRIECRLRRWPDALGTLMIHWDQFLRDTSRCRGQPKENFNAMANPASL